MPTTNALDADQLERQKFEEKVREAMPVGVPKPESEDVDPAALDVAVRGAVNHANGPKPNELAGRWHRWIQEVGDIPEKDRLPDMLPETPGDPTEMLEGAAAFYKKKCNSTGPGRWTDAASLVCWRLAQAAVLRD